MSEAHQTYLRWLEQENRAFVDAAGVDLALPVPSCPGWSVNDLVLHQASFQLWITGLVTDRTTDGRAPTDAVPPPRLGVVDWCESVGTGLVAALRACAADTPVWGVTRHQTAGSWARRQASETSVHRWDAQNAHAAGQPIDHADDYLDEMFVELVPSLVGRFGATAPTGSIELRSLDQQLSWTAEWSDVGTTFGPQQSAADATVTGTTSDLFLAIWNRSAEVEIDGDLGVLDEWRRAIAGS